MPPFKTTVISPSIFSWPGHGNSSIITVGCGDVLGPQGTFMRDNNADVQNFTNSLRGKIKNLTLFGCEIGQNYDSNANHLVKSLATGLHQAGGVAVTVYAPTEDADARPAVNGRAASLSLDVDNQWVHDTVGG
jgi:hypothetical protein